MLGGWLAWYSTIQQLYGPISALPRGLRIRLFYAIRGRRIAATWHICNDISAYCFVRFNKSGMTGVRPAGWGGLASSAWHIDQMGQPPRLRCLGMCTEQVAVVDVSSKCWQNMLKLEMCLYTRQDRWGMRGKRWCWKLRRCTGERRRASDGAGGRRRMPMRGGVAGPWP